ncbi:SOS response-associated peptidase family protein [Propionivibrio soli]|uniref:SOS response-associated peptidase family protein n=1 Tax=Propionivibrio soli TaxID=2976531 RepID=UPI0021E9720A|nr:SOS response-associated peptidase family protein [Propionivibrio soli]
MCYSAMLWEDYHSYIRRYGAHISIDEFVRLFKRRRDGSRLLIPKGMADAFMEPVNAQEREIKTLIDEFNEAEAARLETELFKQRTRLADAERQLKVKTTKKAEEDRRISQAKVAQLLGRLNDLRRTEPQERDHRIYPGYYAPVMVEEGGQLVLKPMRYQCRPQGKPALYDRKFPGTYNARRDNLEGFWKGQFGHTHALVVATCFFENVSRHRLEGRELAEGEAPENVVLKFEPPPGTLMHIACLWSRWSGPEEPDLLSFAAITDAPPPEVAAAGHDRCIIPITRDNVHDWLTPNGDRQRAYAILDARERPYYEHKLAA